jgi:hypothetical protein
MSEKFLMSSTKVRLLSKKRASEPRPTARHLSSLTLCMHVSDRRAQNYSADGTKVTKTGSATRSRRRISHKNHKMVLATKRTKVSKGFDFEIFVTFVADPSL